MDRWFRGGGWGRRRRRRGDCGGCCAEVATPEACPFRSLNDLAPGDACRIQCLRGGGGIRQRLLDAGILPGAEATVIRAAPLRDPIEIRIGEMFVTLRRREAAMVGVEDG